MRGVARRASLLLLPVIYLGFVSLGLPDGTMGVAWPGMHRDLALPVGLAGLLMLWVTMLAAFSGFSSGAVLRRVKTGPVVLISCVLTGSALLLLAEARGLVWLLLAAVPLGLGAGSVDTALNGYVARHYTGRHMNWLHACWGIGATCGPLLMTRALASESGWRGGYWIIGSIQLVLAAIFLCTLSLWSSQPEIVRDKSADVASGPVPTMPANSEAGWLSGVIFLIYVATEMTLGLWASTILVESRGVAPTVAGLCATAYYGSITGGRIAVGFFVDRMGGRRLVSLGLALSSVGAVLFLLASTPLLAACALVLAGLGFAPVYPCLMHEVPKRFAPEAVYTVIGRQSGFSYIGGAVFPAAAGWVAAQWTPGTIAWLIPVGVALMAAAIIRLNRLT